MKFESRSEISCAQSLTLYCEDWQIKEGYNYQVPIGHGKRCDFMVQGVLVEYHPITLPHALHNPAYQTLQKGLSRISQNDKITKRTIREAFKQHLFKEYVHKRLWTIRLNGDDSELIVVDSPAAFYKQVLQRFKAKGRKLPRLKEFERQFREQSFIIR